MVRCRAFPSSACVIVMGVSAAVINGQEISVSAKAAVIRDGKLLVVGYEQPYLHYNLPGGRLRNGEGLRSGLVRRVREECLVEIEIDRLLFVYEHIPDPVAPLVVDYQKVQFTFLAHLRPGDEPRLPDVPGEEDSLTWLDLSEVLAAPIEPPVAHKLMETLGLPDQYDRLLSDARDPVQA